jgi:hypothetical protein
MSSRTPDSAVRTLTALDVVLCLVPIGLFVSILTLV